MSLLQHFLNRHDKRTTVTKKYPFLERVNDYVDNKLLGTLLPGQEEEYQQFMNGLTPEDLQRAEHYIRDLWGSETYILNWLNQDLRT